MTIASRHFVLDEAGEIYRLPSKLRSGMYRDPGRNLLPMFAGKKVRFAEAVVEIIDRKPVQVVSLYFEVDSFDSRGVFDAEGALRRAANNINHMLNEVIDSKKQRTVVDANWRLIKRGASWKPTHAQEATICKAALGQTSVRWIKK